MPRTKRFGRRKADKRIWIVAILAALGLYATYLASCSDPVTTPDPVVTTPATPAPVAVTPTPVEATPAPQPTATPDTRPIHAICNKTTGICTFETDKPRPASAKCTKPAQNDPFYGTWNAVVDNTTTVDVRDICHKVEADDCKPKTVPVQVDFHSAGRHIGHLGPLHQLTFPQKLSPEECEECVEEPRKIYERECGDWGECLPVVGASAVTNGRVCQKTQACTVTEGVDYQCQEDDIRTYDDPATEPCDCPCEDQFTWTAKNTYRIGALLYVKHGSTTVWGPTWVPANSSAAPFVYNTYDELKLYRARIGSDEFLDATTAESCGGVNAAWTGKLLVSCECVPEQIN